MIAAPRAPELRPARRLNGIDATLVVMGGIVGSGIFMTPSVVAERARTVPLILAAWCVGGVLALIGGCIFAEIASRRPSSGGLYGYLRDAFHPSIAFSYGWTALLASQSGGIAAAAITFASYLAPSLNVHRSELALAIAAIVLLSVLNCLGVREGASAQNVLMLLKGGAIVGLVVAGVLVAAPSAHDSVAAVAPSGSLRLVGAMAAALIPVLYAYDGWQTAPFIDRELRDPGRAMARGMLWGVGGVAVLYLLVAATGVHALGASGLAATSTPASAIMGRLLGPAGERFIALGIAISTLGFVSNSILTSARLYYAMAEDGLFFKQIARLHPKTRVPIVAIALQGVVAIGILLAGRYDQILNYVTSIDFVYLALAGAALFVFRRRSAMRAERGFRVPAHPWSTAFFIAVSALVVIAACIEFPVDSGVGMALLAISFPVYFLWRRSAVQRFDPRLRDGDVLIAGPRTDADAADYLALYDDRKATRDAGNVQARSEPETNR